jgi:excisionase family DNA binding protein
MEQIQFIQFTPNELSDLISNKIKAHLVEHFSNFTPAAKVEPEQELISRKEAAALLKVSLVTIHEWCNHDILHYYKMGNRTYFKRSEILEKLYDSNRKKSL